MPENEYGQYSLYLTYFEEGGKGTPEQPYEPRGAVEIGKVLDDAASIAEMADAWKKGGKENEHEKVYFTFNLGTFGIDANYNISLRNSEDKNSLHMLPIVEEEAKKIVEARKEAIYKNEHPVKYQVRRVIQRPFFNGVAHRLNQVREALMSQTSQQEKSSSKQSNDELPKQ